MPTNEPMPEIAAPEADEAVPRYSFDLIAWLDRNIDSPEMPLTSEGFGAFDGAAARQAAFTAGARALVNQLIDWRDEEYSGEDDDIADGTDARFASILREDGVVPTRTSSVSVEI
jgi:hypothetical protein